MPLTISHLNSHQKLFNFQNQGWTRLPPRYKIEADGKLVNWFKDFPVFTVDNLIDTGKDYQQ
jgi:hypothetical protein